MGKDMAFLCLFVFIYIWLAPTGISAASFDCSKATSEVEKIICSDYELSGLDEFLNEAYLEALERSKDKEQIIQRQRQWLKNVRNKCQDEECLRTAYRNRIDEIYVDADEYVLVMSKNDCVCQHMLKIYNEDLKKFGEIKYDRHEEFRAIKWNNQKSFRQLSDKNITEHDTLISRFDINNDGKPEIIIQDDNRTLNSIDSDLLYIFREKDFADLKDKIVINEDFANKAIGEWGFGVLGKKPFEANVYMLHELPAFEVWRKPTGKHSKIYYSLGGWFYFNPFLYKGKYFTSMHDLPDCCKSWDARCEHSVKLKWEVIVQFTPENQLKDICYLLKIPNCKNKKGHGN